MILTIVTGALYNLDQVGKQTRIGEKGTIMHIFHIIYNTEGSRDTICY